MARPSRLHPVSSWSAADRRIAFSSASSVFSRYLLFDLTEHTVLGAEGSLRLGIDVGLVVEFYCPWPVKSFVRDHPCSDRIYGAQRAWKGCREKGGCRWKPFTGKMSWPFGKKNFNEASDETAGGREIQRSREWRDEIKREWGILDDYRYHRWATVLPTTVARVPTYRRESTILGYYRYFSDTGVRDVWQTDGKGRKRREGKR